MKMEAWSGHVTCPRPCSIASGGVRIWTQLVCLKIASTVLCCEKESGSRWYLATWVCLIFLEHTLYFHEHIMYIFILIVALFKNVHFTHLCILKFSCSFKAQEARFLHGSRDCLPLVGTELLPLQVSFTECFLFHMFVSPSLVLFIPSIAFTRSWHLSIYWLELHSRPRLLDWSMNLIRQVI